MEQLIHFEKQMVTQGRWKLIVHVGDEKLSHVITHAPLIDQIDSEDQETSVMAKIRAIDTVLISNEINAEITYGGPSGNDFYISPLTMKAPGVEIKNQADKFFFLFGEYASREYDRNGVANITPARYDGALFIYDESSMNATDLLGAYSGWDDYTKLTEEDYNILKSRGY